MTTLRTTLTRRRLLAGFAATAGAAVLSACGADATATNTPASAATSGSTAAPAATTSLSTTAPTAGATSMAAPATRRSIEIEVAHWLSNAGHPINELFDAFNKKNTGVIVKGRVDGADYLVVLQKAQASLAAGKPPAIVTTAWRYAPYAESALGIVGLDEIGGSEAREVYARYPDNALKNINIGGKIVGLPFAFSTPVLYYNQDMFREAGLDPARPPTTWDEAFAYAEKLKATGKEAIGHNLDEWPAQAFVQANGGNVLDAGGKVAFDSPEAVGGYKVMLSSIQRGYLSPAKEAEVRSAWNAGNIGLYVTSIANLGAFRTNARMRFSTAPFPTIGGRPRRMQSGGNFLGVYARNRDQRAAAWEFLKFVSSEEGARIWAKVGYMNATKWQVETLPGQEAAYTQLTEGLTTETIWPGMRGLEASKLYNDWLQRWVAAPTTIDGTVQQAKAEIAALLP